MSRESSKARQKRRTKKTLTSINLVSLMDIFTILVFFLLVNSTDVEVLSGKGSVKLPESVSDKVPNETLVIMVDDEAVTLQGRKIADVGDVLTSEKATIVGLQKELEYQASRLPPLRDKDNQGAPSTHAITIMGDKEIPYLLLRKIMLTCAESNFGNISLAVQRKSTGES